MKVNKELRSCKYFDTKEQAAACGTLVWMQLKEGSTFAPKRERARQTKRKTPSAPEPVAKRPRSGPESVPAAVPSGATEEETEENAASDDSVATADATPTLGVTMLLFLERLEIRACGYSERGPILARVLSLEGLLGCSSPMMCMLDRLKDVQERLALNEAQLAEVELLLLRKLNSTSIADRLYELEEVIGIDHDAASNGTWFSRISRAKSMIQ